MATTATDSHAVEMDDIDQAGAPKTDEDIDVVEEDTCGMKVFAKTILPFLYTTVFISLVMVILFPTWGHTQPQGLQSLFLMLVVLPLIFGGVLCAWGTFKFGVIMDQINRFKEENNKYESELGVLRATKDKLAGEVEGLQSTVNELQQDASELENQLDQFEELRKQLEDIAADNEELNRMLEDTNNMFNDMRETVLQNERAHLLNFFYECALKDGDEGMSKREYRRFLGRLSQKQREKFEEQGTFEELAGDDNQIDLREFQGILEKVLSDVDELLKAEFQGDEAKYDE